MTQDNSLDKDKVEIRRDYYEPGVLYSETPYVNGKMHGVERGYYKSGAQWIEVSYVDGKRHGVEKSYYKSGAL